MSKTTQPKEPEVTLELAQEHGLTAEEFEKIKEYLGRVPNFTELGIYSVMWSEHCSYKNSILQLKKLPNEGPQLLVEAGEENAGLVDLGDDLACAFKVESHNHPSAIEPYEGAATGVGGIHRDIFTMGARPVASLDSLRFGSLDEPRTRFLLDGVVRGIADYGNSFGVPTVAGEVYFDEHYKGNPLVNAMSVGIVKKGETVSATARGVGNPVLVVGSSTGRDGIHGATFASEEISDESEEKRPSVQKGDPFTEKLLLEASLEAIKTGAVVGMQDMGAAGLSSSSSEMSAREGFGMDMDLDKVPVREEQMTAYEMLLSESQERMLVVAEKGREQEIIDVFEKWDLNAVQVGQVTDTGRLRYTHQGELKADIPADSLVLGGGAPQYEREAKKPAYLDQVQAFDEGGLEHPSDLNGVIRELVKSPNICSRRWLHEQYDTMVRTNTVQGPGPSNGGVIRLKGTKKALSVKTDGNGRYVYLNPRRGGQIAVAEAARNVVCTGAKPMAITNCLNFGNPYKPEAYWTLSEAVGGMSEACLTLNTPVTGGNVSLYNEHPDGAIFPTPVVGMLGLIDDVEKHSTTPALKNEGDALVYIGAPRRKLGGSEYLSLIHGLTTGDAPQINLEFEARLQTGLLSAIKKGLVTAAHDISDGGLAVTLAEMAIYGQKGLVMNATPLGSNLHEVLFSEAQSGVVVTVSPKLLETFKTLMEENQIPVYHIGNVQGTEMKINSGVNIPVEELSRLYENTLPQAMKL